MDVFGSRIPEREGTAVEREVLSPESLDTCKTYLMGLSNVPSGMSKYSLRSDKKKWFDS